MVLGVDGADAGASFIDEVRIASLGVTLTRTTKGLAQLALPSPLDPDRPS